MTLLKRIAALLALLAALTACGGKPVALAEIPIPPDAKPLALETITSPTTTISQRAQRG
jgi:hypothetical protein